MRGGEAADVSEAIACFDLPPGRLRSCTNVYAVDINASNPMDALGRVSAAYYGPSGTGPAETYNFDPGNLQLATLQTTNPGGGYLQRYTYQWEANGNLKSRYNADTDVSETFTYDDLNRLKMADRTASGSGTTTTMSLTYQPNGNILTKTGFGNDVGTYHYGTDVANGAGPHAVQAITGGDEAGQFHYDAVGNLNCRAWNGTACAANSDITWYSFNLPQVINFAGSGGGNHTDFAYGPDRERVKQKVVTASPAEDKTIYYIEPHFEVEMESGGTVRYRANVFFGNRFVYSQLEIPSAPSGQQVQQFYVHQDYQGSIDQVSFAGGYNPSAVKKYSFDAYGKRRELDWSNDADNSTFEDNHWIDVGYTGHVQLDNVEFIHMNGRVQNPIWGRMLSVDPMIGDFQYPQSLNPYSYGNNNPVTLVDPTGLYSDAFSACEYGAPDGADCGPIEEIVVDEIGEIVVTTDPWKWITLVMTEWTITNLQEERLRNSIGTRLANYENFEPEVIPGPTAKENSPQSQQPPCTLVAPTGRYTTAAGVDARFNADTAAMLSTALTNLNQQGITPVITSGYRSPDAQAVLRNGSDPTVITPARVSWHQAGAAVDIGPNSNAGNFDTIRAAMSQAGFVWGGTFRTPDRPHFQSQPAGTSPSAELVQSCVRAAGGG